MSNAPKVTVHKEEGPAQMSIGGTRYVWETTVIRYDDWRQTPFGMVNFGRVTLLGPHMRKR